MCGIAGFIDFKNKSNLDILRNMSDTLHHRGPDGEGCALFQEEKAIIGLGHRRLSVIDLSEGGKQPMSFENLSITFNGEIYNYIEIRDELLKNGHVFVSGSDTEVILHAYSEWGGRCVDRFVGMFAFVIFDHACHQIFICRDRAGVKPLFYYWQDGLFLFASELKAFHQHPYFKKDIDIDSVAAFMQYGYIPTPHCIFKNCHKLQPGHFLLIDMKSASYTISKYWDVYDYYNKPKLDIDFEEAKIETERILQKAFDYRMVADVPVGVFLSGGYDSTSVTALLQKDRTQKIKTYTIGVGDDTLNEAPFAKQIAHHLGTEHSELYCTQKDALDIIPNLPFFYDEPFGDYSAIPTILVSRMARQEVTVALSADAGDEVFAGYNRYDYEYKYAWLSKLPSSMKRTGVKLLEVVPINTIPILKEKLLLPHRYERLKFLLRSTSSKSLMTSLTTQFVDKQLDELFIGDVKRNKNYFDSTLREGFADGISQMMATDYQTYLLDDILQKVDRATMSVSLEGREPFLDHNVIEWAAQLPTIFKYNKGNKKYILKEIVHQYLSREMMDRPKMGFAIPINKWLKNELRPLIESQLNQNRIVSENIFNWEIVEFYKDSFLKGRDEYALKVWYLLVFQMWYEKWS